MKLNKNTKNIILISSGFLLVSGVVYAIINANTKNKWEAELLEAISKGVKETGTIEDIQAGDGFNENYWKTVPSGSRLPSVSAAKIISNSIYKDLNGYNNNTQLMADLTGNVSSKAELSRVSDEFQKQYGKRLVTFLLDNLNKSYLFGLPVFTNDIETLNQIQTFTKNLPNTI
tara:strand:+ start:17002 stop:17520 length:519 start_codon:yes stop_codon:yes gene_type:complete